MPQSKQKIERIRHTIDLNDELDLHIISWKVQRIGWVLLYMLMGGAALGLFGNGMLSKVETEKGKIIVSFDRFFRYEASMELEIEGNESHNFTTIAFPQNYLKKFKVENVVPQPIRIFTQYQNVIYQFEGDATRSVKFYLVPKEIGQVNGTMIVNRSPFILKHFIYP